MFGVQQSLYAHTLLAGSSPSRIAWIGSVQMALLLGLGPLVGYATERGRFRWVFHGGSVVLVAGAVSLGSCTGYGCVFVVQGLVMGLGMGCAFMSCVVVVGQYFKARLGLAATIGAAGSAVGGMVYCGVLKVQLQIGGHPYGWDVSDDEFWGIFEKFSSIVPETDDWHRCGIWGYCARLH
jgi:MFS family permease